MNDKRNDSPDAAAGVPRSDPPDPNDDDRLRPEDLAPGLGGTSKTKPEPAAEPTDDE
jgi:hypothetical protein